VTALKYTIATPDADLGSALKIELPQGYAAGKQFVLRITYKTQPTARAFSWLSPKQTLGKKLPFLFTQCQAIACRSLAPMQDTPSVKFTYDA
jgi:leukotriene-A4 hydrolase